MIEVEKGKMLIIYDVDNTLHLYKLNDTKRSAFECQLQNKFVHLYDHGIILAVASYNKDAASICEQMGISKYLTYVLGDPSYYSNGGKVAMIEKVVEKFPDMSKEQVLFFDDDADIVHDVREYGIDCICVS